MTLETELDDILRDLRRESLTMYPGILDLLEPTKARLKKYYGLAEVRAQFVELCEAVHSMRGDPSKPWQEDMPEYAATVARIEDHLK